jgi:hypothetical protein
MKAVASRAEQIGRPDQALRIENFPPRSTSAQRLGNRGHQRWTLSSVSVDDKCASNHVDERACIAKHLHAFLEGAGDVGLIGSDVAVSVVDFLSAPLRFFVSSLLHARNSWADGTV